MDNPNLHQLFIDELSDTYSACRQIVKALPKFINLASYPELKETLSKNLKETEKQVSSIEKVFTNLKIPTKEMMSEGMRGLIAEANSFVDGKAPSPTLDAAIISGLQKVKHFEIAAYNTLCNFAKQLKLDSKSQDLLRETWNEINSAEKKLTKIAEGSLFSSGVNKEAAVAGGKMSR